MSGILFAHQKREVSTEAQQWLKELGIECIVVECGVNAKKAIEKLKPDLIFTQIDLPDEDGFEVLNFTREWNPHTPVIFMANRSNVALAVKAIKCGAYDYIELPLTREKLCDMVASSEHLIHAFPYAALARETAHFFEIENDLGYPPSLKKFNHLLIKVSRTNANVFISGESGTGKELVAKTIHHLSERRNNPFIPLDCVALPSSLLESELFGYEKGAFTGAVQCKPGLIELANGGTLFLDEITELDMSLQAKLLRVIQERQFRRIGGQKMIRVDIRIISAANRNPELAVKQNRLRQDLFYRLHVVPIVLPPLRERKEDIPFLLSFFLNKYCRIYKLKSLKISAEAMKVLQIYVWPGNVRELQNIAERLVSVSDKEIINPQDLPETILLNTSPIVEKVEALSFKKAKQRYLQTFCARYFASLSKKYDGNISQMAKEAKVSRSTIYKIIKTDNLQIGGTR
ncbi:MAG TPA: sigma-54 dependent transcriptional regulator [bacterium]|nr:sigma-54 dependent transcriptional regulator [bacterium]HPG45160.1 sigma-54 dependent transcriptional regulator [bacterium]HPM97402.1 sigma-54 dependent transcriptional regulator [bacterium]